MNLLQSIFIPKIKIETLKLFKGKDIVLNLDATGSLIGKPSKVNNIIYYYALTLQHPDYCTSPIPVAEMISSDHGTAENIPFFK